MGACSSACTNGPKQGVEISTQTDDPAPNILRKPAITSNDGSTSHRSLADVVCLNGSADAHSFDLLDVGHSGSRSGLSRSVLANKSKLSIGEAVVCAQRSLSPEMSSKILLRAIHPEMILSRDRSQSDRDAGRKKALYLGQLPKTLRDEDPGVSPAARMASTGPKLVTRVSAGAATGSLAAIAANGMLRDGSNGSRKNRAAGAAPAAALADVSGKLQRTSPGTLAYMSPPSSTGQAAGISTTAPHDATRLLEQK